MHRHFSTTTCNKDSIIRDVSAAWQALRPVSECRLHLSCGRSKFFVTCWTYKQETHPLALQNAIRSNLAALFYRFSCRCALPRNSWRLPKLARAVNAAVHHLTQLPPPAHPLADLAVPVHHSARRPSCRGSAPHAPWSPPATMESSPLACAQCW